MWRCRRVWPRADVAAAVGNQTRSRAAAVSYSARALLAVNANVAATQQSGSTTASIPGSNMADPLAGGAAAAAAAAAKADKASRVSATLISSNASLKRAPTPGAAPGLSVEGRAAAAAGAANAAASHAPPQLTPVVGRCRSPPGLGPSLLHSAAPPPPPHAAAPSDVSLLPSVHSSHRRMSRACACLHRVHRRVRRLPLTARAAPAFRTPQREPSPNMQR